MILAGGHYKQTQSNYIIAAILNIVISIATVSVFGLIGVSIGTLVAMVYQTVWMARYTSRNLLKWPFVNFLKQIVVDVITVLICIFLAQWITMSTISYVAWSIMAIKTVFTVALVVVIVNCVCFKRKLSIIVKRITKR